MIYLFRFLSSLYFCDCNWSTRPTHSHFFHISCPSVLLVELWGWPRGSLTPVYLNVSWFPQILQVRWRNVEDGQHLLFGGEPWEGLRALHEVLDPIRWKSKKMHNNDEKLSFVICLNIFRLYVWNLLAFLVFSCFLASFSRKTTRLANLMTHQGPCSVVANFCFRHLWN